MGHMSASYMRRLDMMQSLEIPTISEVKEELGLPLADIVFDQCPSELKSDMGLEPYLEGAGDQLWISPSDLLIGKVCLKPPLTQKHMQALTHQGILEIGSIIEQKYWNEMEMEKARALQEQEENLRRMFEVQKERLLSELQQAEQLKYLDQMQELRTFYENKINQLIWETYEQVKRLEEEMVIELNSLNMLWQERLQDEIKETVEKLTEEFLEKMRLQEQILVDLFRRQIENCENQRKCELQFERVKAREIVIQIKHHLECQNVANLMYILCKERQKCKEEKTSMQNQYKKQIRNLRKQIGNHLKTIRELRRIQVKQTKQIAVRERVLIEILRQFRKFFYFALKAAPTQGEFLLDLDRLLRWELEDYCIEERRQKNDPLVKMFVCESVDIPVIDAANLLEPSYHSIVEEESEQMEESDALPAFYFNDKMYVREDFRDMFNTGITIDRKHPLWNKDVEELLIIFKKIIEEKRFEQKSKIRASHQSIVHFNKNFEELSKENLENELSKTSIEIKTSIMASNSKLTEKPEKSPRKISDTDQEVELRKESLTSSLDAYKAKHVRQSTIIERIPSQIISIPTIKNEELKLKRSDFTAPSKLTIARDSVILQLSAMEKRSLQNIAKTNSEQKNPEEVILKLSKMSLETLDKNKNIENEYAQPSVNNSIRSFESSGNRHATSKLLLATDSIEIIKSQMNIPIKTSPKKVTTATKPIKKTVVKKRVSAPPPKKSPVKTPPKAKIAGQKSTKEHLKTVDEFNEERVKSLISVMKQNPSLLRLFTSCSQ